MNPLLRIFVLLAFIYHAPTWALFTDKPPYMVTVNEPHLDMHTGPGEGYPIYYVAERGENLEIVLQQTSWFKVRNNQGKEGWAEISDMNRTLDVNAQPNYFYHPSLDNPDRRQWEGGFITGKSDDLNQLGAYLGYTFYQHYTVETTFSENIGDYTTGNIFSINTSYQFSPNWRYSPFILFGIGKHTNHYSSHLNGDTSESDTIANIGVGLRIHLTRGLFIRSQYIHSLSLSNSIHQREVNQWNIGLSAFF